MLSSTCECSLYAAYILLPCTKLGKIRKMGYIRSGCACNAWLYVLTYMYIIMFVASGDVIAMVSNKLHNPALNS